jgi:hypothetical protein
MQCAGSHSGPHIQNAKAARTLTEQVTGQVVFPAYGATVCFGGFSAPTAGDLTGHVPGTCHQQHAFVLDQHA